VGNLQKKEEPHRVYREGEEGGSYKECSTAALYLSRQEEKAGENRFQSKRKREQLQEPSFAGGRKKMNGAVGRSYGGLGEERSDQAKRARPSSTRGGESGNGTMENVGGNIEKKRRGFLGPSDEVVPNLSPSSREGGRTDYWLQNRM